MDRRRLHLPGCECGLAICAAIREDADLRPSRRWVLGRFETLLAMKDAVVQVSAHMARVEADGAILLLTLTPVVLALISAVGKMPRLEFGVAPVLDPVVGERRALRHPRED